MSSNELRTLKRLLWLTNVDFTLSQTTNVENFNKNLYEEAKISIPFNHSENLEKRICNEKNVNTILYILN